MPNEITLTYDPWTLPTAQHRAGLAGLLVLVESMRRRGLGPLPTIEALVDERYKVTIDKHSLTRLFNDLYDAEIIEIRQKAKRSGSPPKRIETEPDAKSKEEKTIYVYDRLVPKAAFLTALGCPPIWVALWRDAVLGVVRKIPATRKPYQERLDGRDPKEATKVWNSLISFDRDSRTGKVRVESVAGSVYLGAMESSAEAVEFLGRVDENFLLHFWQVVAAFYQVESVDRDGMRSYIGFAIAIPDVEDFDGFAADYSDLVAQLDPTHQGIRPADGVIALPEEGALEFLHNVAAIADAKAQSGERALTIAGVDVFAIESLSKGIRHFGAHRIEASDRLLDGYESIRRRYRHPLFRRQLVLNLLRDRPWYSGFARLFATNAREHFVGKHSTGFAADARSHFNLFSRERSTP